MDPLAALCVGLNVRLVESYSQTCLTELAVGLQCLQDEDSETLKAGRNW